MKKNLFGLTALTSLLLAGCSATSIGTADRTTAAAYHDASRYFDQARQPLPPARTSTVRVVDGVWSTGSARRSDHGDPLPRKWDSPPGVSFDQAAPIDMYEIGTMITKATGITVTFGPDVEGGQVGGASSIPPASRAPAIPAGPAGGNLDSLLSSLNVASGTPGAAGGNTANVVGGQIRSVSGSRQEMLVHFSGKLSAFLNQVGSHFGLTWEYTGGGINVFRNVTRTFTVHALSADVSLSSVLTADASTDGGSGTTATSNQHLKSDTTVAIWKDIGTTIGSIVSGSGTVASSVSTGTITVTAPAEIVNRVQTFVDATNTRLSKQVTVSAQILTVDFTDGDQFNLDIQGMLKDAGQYGFTFGNAVGSAGAAAAGAVRGTNALGATVVSPGNSFSGTNALISAIATKGRITDVETATLTTVNGIPAPLQVANTRDYAKQVSVTATGASSGGGAAATQTSITPGSVTTGFSLTLIPRVDPDGNGLLLQFGMNVSELNGATNGFDVFSSGGQTIQLRNVNSRNFVQQSWLPNGSTLVLTGFEKKLSSSTRTGTGVADFIGLGGSANGSNVKETLVILLTPTVLSNQIVTTGE